MRHATGSLPCTHLLSDVYALVTLWALGRRYAKAWWHDEVRTEERRDCYEGMRLGTRKSTRQEGLGSERPLVTALLPSQTHAARAEMRNCQERARRIDRVPSVRQILTTRSIPQISIATSLSFGSGTDDGIVAVHGGQRPG